MSTKSKAKGNRNHEKGADTERKAAAYLRAWWPEVDRRLREGRRDDQGDLDGVPYACSQVKYWEKPRLQEWVTQTLKQRDRKGVPLCWIISRVKYKPVEQWDVYMPAWQVIPAGSVEGEAWTWVRMEFRLAVAVMQGLIVQQDLKSLSPPSLSTTA